MSLCGLIWGAFGDVRSGRESRIERLVVWSPCLLVCMGKWRGREGRFEMMSGFLSGLAKEP